jgi:hypothetical protein
MAAGDDSAAGLSRIRFVRQTGYYPLYDGENDQIDPVARVGRARFQRVVPRYRLSSSETSDTGLGPTFYDVPVYGPAPGTRGRAAVATGRDALESPARPDRRPPAGSTRPAAPLPPYLGTHIDTFA